MSNLLVQNIKHTNNTTSMAIDTSGQVTIRGEGSATTTNLQQGLAKQWAFYNQQTPAVGDSFNTSSITDSSTGTYLVNFSNNHASTNYSAHATGLDIGSYYCITNPRPTFSTSQYRVDTIRASQVDTMQDPDDSSTATLGDLA